MFLNTDNNVFPNTATLISLIDELRNAEMSRHAGTFKKLIKPYWGNLSKELILPDHIKPEFRAELLRLCGYFLSLIGRSKGIADFKTFQERGRNLTNQAIEIFTGLGLHDAAAIARVTLSTCFYYEGNIAQAEKVIDEIVLNYADDSCHPVALNCQIHRLVFLYISQKFDEAERLIAQMRIPIDLCGDARITARYHLQAGTIYSVIFKSGLALSHFEEAVKHAKRFRNYRMIAFSLNNQAMTYFRMNDLETAHKYLNRSVEILDKLGDKAWLAITDDSRAQIFLAQGKISEAEKSINSSIDFLSMTESYKDLCDGLYTRARIYLKNSRINLAVLDIAKIIEICKTTAIGLDFETYVNDFSELLEPVDKLRFEENLTSKKQNSRAKKNTSTNSKIKSQKTEAAPPRTINGLGTLAGAELIFRFPVPKSQPLIFYCDISEMNNLCGIAAECYVACFNQGEPGIGSMVLIKHNDVYFFSRVSFAENFTDLTVSHQKFGTLALKNLAYFGEPLGFAPFIGEPNRETIEFAPIKF